MNPDISDLPGTIIVPEADIRPAFAQHMREIIREHILGGEEVLHTRLDDTWREFVLPKAEQLFDFVAMRDIGLRRGQTKIAIVTVLIPERPSRYTQASRASRSYIRANFGYTLSPSRDNE